MKYTNFEVWETKFLNRIQNMYNKTFSEARGIWVNNEPFILEKWNVRDDAEETADLIINQ